MSQHCHFLSSTVKPSNNLRKPTDEILFKMIQLKVLASLFVFLSTVTSPGLCVLITEPQNTTAVIYNETRLICQVDNPESYFEWVEYVTTSFGKVIFSSPPGGQPEDPRYVIENTFDLLILNTELRDGGFYGCRTFEMGTYATVVLVVLDVPVLLVPVLIENQTTQLSCSANYGGPRPEEITQYQRPTLHLYVDGNEQGADPELLPGNPPQDGQNFRASVLTLRFNYTPAITDQDRELRCEIRTKTPAAKLSSTVLVQVRYPVRNIRLFPVEEVYRIGDEINCTAEGNPTPDITWTPIKSPYPWMPTTSTLFILESMVGENEWKCTAKNTAEMTEFIEAKIAFIVESGSANGVAKLEKCFDVFVLSSMAAVVLQGWLVKH